MLRKQGFHCTAVVMIINMNTGVLDLKQKAYLFSLWNFLTCLIDHSVDLSLSYWPKKYNEVYENVLPFT